MLRKKDGPGPVMVSDTLCPAVHILDGLTDGQMDRNSLLCSIGHRPLPIRCPKTTSIAFIKVSDTESESEKYRCHRKDFLSFTYIPRILILFWFQYHTVSRNQFDITAVLSCIR